MDKLGNSANVYENHPSYRHPTIAEVVCDVHFQLASDHPWQARYLSSLISGMQDEYPEVEPVTQVEMQVEMTPEGVRQKMVPSSPRVRFTHTSHKLVAQVGPTNAFLSILPIYPGWAEVKQDISYLWDQVQSVVNPSVINRVGLRYINRIDLEEPSQSPGQWLRSSEFIPEAVLHSKPGFLSRCQVQRGDHDRITVTVGDVTVSSEEDRVAILFDIDRILVRDIGPSTQALLTELDRLHEEIWQVFSTSKTSKLEELLSRREE